MTPEIETLVARIKGGKAWSSFDTDVDRLAHICETQREALERIRVASEGHGMSWELLADVGEIAALALTDGEAEANPATGSTWTCSNGHSGLTLMTIDGTCNVCGAPGASIQERVQEGE